MIKFVSLQLMLIADETKQSVNGLGIGFQNLIAGSSPISIKMMYIIIYRCFGTGVNCFVSGLNF